MAYELINAFVILIFILSLIVVLGYVALIGFEQIYKYLEDKWN